MFNPYLQIDMKRKVVVKQTKTGTLLIRTSLYEKYEKFAKKKMQIATWIWINNTDMTKPDCMVAPSNYTTTLSTGLYKLVKSN